MHYNRKQFEIKGEIPEPLETVWTGPLVVRHLPPRDWPPRGWEVDREELEFMREAHKLQAERVDIEELDKKVKTVTGSEEICLDRYKVFLKQYNEWVAANKDGLEEESYKVLCESFRVLSVFLIVIVFICFFGILEFIMFFRGIDMKARAGLLL